MFPVEASKPSVKTTSAAEKEKNKTPPSALAANVVSVQLNADMPGASTTQPKPFVNWMLDSYKKEPAKKPKLHASTHASTHPSTSAMASISATASAGTSAVATKTISGLQSINQPAPADYLQSRLATFKPRAVSANALPTFSEPMQVGYLQSRLAMFQHPTASAGAPSASSEPMQAGYLQARLAALKNPTASACAPSAFSAPIPAGYRAQPGYSESLQAGYLPSTLATLENPIPSTSVLPGYSESLQAGYLPSTLATLENPTPSTSILPGYSESLQAGYLPSTLAMFENKSPSTSELPTSLVTIAKEARVRAEIRSDLLEAKKEIIEDYQDGYSQRFIAEERKMTLVGVQTIIKEHEKTYGPLARQKYRPPEPDQDGFVPIMQGVGRSIPHDIQKQIVQLDSEDHPAEEIQGILLAQLPEDTDLPGDYKPRPYMPGTIRQFLTHYKNQAKDAQNIP